jgi:hypothetical protein
MPWLRRWWLFASLLAGAFNGVHGVGQLANCSPRIVAASRPTEIFTCDKTACYPLSGGMPATAFLLELTARLQEAATGNCEFRRGRTN